MIMVTEAMRQKVQNKRLNVMLEQIAQELAPKYDNALVVKRHEGDPYFFDFSADYKYIAERKPGKKFLGLFPTADNNPLVLVVEGFPRAHDGKKILRVQLADEALRPVVEKYVNNYAQEYGVTEITIEKFSWR